MTIAASTRYTTYNPVVATTAFAVGFPIFDNTDLLLLHNGVSVAFTVTATYVDGVSSNAVVNASSPGLTGSVIVVGMRSTRRTDQYASGAPLPIRDHNYALNRLTAEIQETRRDIDRSVKAAVGTAGPALPTKVSGKLIGWNDTGLENKEFASTSLLTLPSGIAADAGKELVVGLLGTPYIIHEPTFLNPTRRWAIDGTGSAGDQTAWAAALLWAQTSKRSLTLPDGEFTVPAVLTNLSAEDASVVEIAGFTFYRPSGGLRLFGRGSDRTRFLAPTTADNMALLKLDGNSDNYAGSPGVDSRAQGKNVIAGIGFRGRGRTNGADLRAIDIRANWNTEILDCEFFGFSGDVIKVYSAIAGGSGFDDSDGSAFLTISGIRASHCGKFFMRCTDARLAGLYLEKFNVREMTGGFAKLAIIHSTIAEGSWSSCGNVTDQTGGLWLMNAASGAITRNVNITRCSAEANFVYEVYAEQCEGLKIDGFQPTVYQPAATEGSAIPNKAGVVLGAGAKHVDIRFGTAPGQSRAAGVADYTAPYVRALAGSERIKIRDTRFNMTLVPHIVIADNHVGGIVVENVIGAFHATNNPNSEAVIQYGTGVENVKVDGQVTRRGSLYPVAKAHADNAAVVINVTGDGTIALLNGLVTMTEEYDYGALMGTGAVFTAKEAGWYAVEGRAQLTGFAAASHAQANLYAVRNALGTPVYNVLDNRDLTTLTLAAGTLLNLMGSKTIYLLRGDTIEMAVQASGGGGTKTVDLNRNTAAPWVCEFSVRAIT